MMSGDLDLQRHAAAEVRVGNTLKGKWHLDHLLGVGGMAAVYAATHRNGNRVAIKVLHPEAALIPNVQSRFLREGYLANRVSHPGAVSILDDDVDETGATFLVLELLDGATLETVFTRRPSSLSSREVLAIAHEILGVLAVAHDREIVHRDLKPANVFIERSGAVRVLDFGIARLLDPSSGPGETAGQPIGTPGFMPPEQARGRSADVGRETDIWAVGATMFYLFTGRTVHEGGTIAEQLVAAITQPVPPIASVAPNLPAEIAAIVDRALAYHRSDRYADARLMQRDVAAVYAKVVGVTLTGTELQAVLSHLPSPSMVPTAPTLVATPARSAGQTAIGTVHTNPARPRSSRRAVIGLTLALATVGVGAIALRDRIVPPGPLAAAPGEASATSAAQPVVPVAVVPVTAPPTDSPAPSASAPAAAPVTPAAVAGRGGQGVAKAPAAPRPARTTPAAAAMVPPAVAPEAEAKKSVDLFGRRE